jgi:hypothetical protein
MNDLNPFAWEGRRQNLQDDWVRNADWVLCLVTKLVVPCGLAPGNFYK